MVSATLRSIQNFASKILLRLNRQSLLINYKYLSIKCLDINNFIIGYYDGLMARLLDGQGQVNRQTIKPSDHQDVIVKLIFVHSLTYMIKRPEWNQ